MGSSDIYLGTGPRRPPSRQGHHLLCCHQDEVPTQPEPARARIPAETEPNGASPHPKASA